jgi:hypothetical protein
MVRQSDEAERELVPRACADGFYPFEDQDRVRRSEPSDRHARQESLFRERETPPKPVREGVVVGVLLLGGGGVRRPPDHDLGLGGVHMPVWIFDEA